LAEPVHDAATVVGTDEQKLLLHGRERTQGGILVLEEVRAPEELPSTPMARAIAVSKSPPGCPSSM
jgi:hypothetical protein